MRVKLDENLPESLLPALSALGHDVDNVRLEGLVGQPDIDVWQAAKAAERFFLTQDLDFSDIRPESWARCFVLLTDHKLRVHQPPQ